MRLSTLVLVALVVALAFGAGAAGRLALATAGPEIGLTGDVLIADADNNRLLEVTPDKRIAWEFPRPGDLAPGQSFRDPDDAFYTPGGRTIITNQEANHTITIIDYPTHRIVWQ